MTMSAVSQLLWTEPKRYVFERLRPFIIGVRTVIFHPIFIFVVLQIVSVSVTVIWVYWYMNRDIVKLMPNIAEQYDLGYFITGVVLSVITLLGTTFLFVFAIKQRFLNRQQSSFVSSVTHELRSPIASMQLSLETIRARDLDQVTMNQLHKHMTVDLERLVKLVDQILVSARLDRGIRMFNEVEDICVRDLIEQVVLAAKHLDQRLEERITIECDPAIIWQSAKPALNLVLTNLVENAIKYSPPKTPIVVQAETTDSHLVFRVRDQGFGLDKRDRKRIFKIFRRAETATKLAIPGTGLGLYIVKTIVGILGGKVRADSQGLGLGCTFVVTLPQHVHFHKPWKV